MNSMMNLLIGSAVHSETKAEFSAQSLMGGAQEGEAPNFWNLIQSLVVDRQEIQLTGVVGAMKSLATAQVSQDPGVNQGAAGEKAEKVNPELMLAVTEEPKSSGIRAGQQTREEKNAAGSVPAESEALLLTSMLGSIGVVQQTQATHVDTEHIQAPVSTTAVVETANPAVTQPVEMTAEVQSTVAAAVIPQSPGGVVQPEGRQHQAQAQMQAEVQPNTGEVPQQTPSGKAGASPEEAVVEPAVSSDVRSTSSSAKTVEVETPAVEAVTPEAGNDVEVQIAAAPEKAVPAAKENAAEVSSRRLDAAQPAEVQAQAVAPRQAGAGQPDGFAAVINTESADILQASVQPVDTTGGTQMNASDKSPVPPPLDPGLVVNHRSESAPAQPSHAHPAGEIGTRIVNQIVRAARTQILDGGASMTLRLDPPHLGTIRMNVVAVDGVVTAALEAGTESAKRIIEANLGVLRETLAQTGVNVDSINVSVNTNQDYGWRWNGKQGGPGNGHPNAPWSANADEVTDDPHPLLTMAQERPSSSSGFDYLA